MGFDMYKAVTNLKDSTYNIKSEAEIDFEERLKTDPIGLILTRENVNILSGLIVEILVAREFEDTLFCVLLNDVVTPFPDGGQNFRITYCDSIDAVFLNAKIVFSAGWPLFEFDDRVFDTNVMFVNYCIDSNIDANYVSVLNLKDDGDKMTVSYLFEKAAWRDLAANLANVPLSKKILDEYSAEEEYAEKIRLFERLNNIVDNKEGYVFVVSIDEDFVMSGNEKIMLLAILFERIYKAYALPPCEAFVFVLCDESGKVKGDFDRFVECFSEVSEEVSGLDDFVDYIKGLFGIGDIELPFDHNKLELEFNAMQEHFRPYGSVYDTLEPGSVYYCFFDAYGGISPRLLEDLLVKTNTISYITSLPLVGARLHRREKDQGLAYFSFNMFAESSPLSTFALKTKTTATADYFIEKYEIICKVLDGLGKIHSIDEYKNALLDMHNAVEAIFSRGDPPIEEFYIKLKEYITANRTDWYFEEAIQAYAPPEPEPTPENLSRDFVNPFETVYDTLCVAYDLNHNISFSGVQGLLNIADFFAAAGFSSIAVKDKKDIILDRELDDDPDADDSVIYGVLVSGASKINEFDCEVNLQITDDGYYGQSFVAYLDAKLDGGFTLPDIPFLVFEDVVIRLKAYEKSKAPDSYFNGRIQNTDLTVYLDMFATAGLINVMGIFDTPLTAFSAFSALAGGIDFKAALPQQLQTLGDVGLKSFGAVFDENKKEITAMTFELGVSKAWVIYDDILTINPHITLSIASPMDMANRSVHISVSGDCSFGKEGKLGTLALYGGYPPFEVGARLVTPALKLGDLLNELGVRAKIDLDITNLEFSAKFKESYYLFSAAVTSDWEICKQFTVTGLGFRFEKTGGKYSVKLAGSAKICKDIEAVAAVSYNSVTYGWDFYAAMNLSSKSVSVGDLITQYHGGGVCGAADGTVPVGQFSARYETSSGDFSVSASCSDWYIDFLDTTLSAELSIGSTAKSIYCFLAADVKWQNIDVNVSLHYDEKGGTQFQLKWGELTAVVDTKLKTAAFTLEGFSVGKIVETMVSWATGVKFGLEEPWSILNDISLTEMKLVFCFGEQKSVSLIVAIDKEFGFAKIENLTLSYENEKGKDKKQVLVTLDGSFVWDDDKSPKSWNAAKPGDAPAPQGKGAKYFDLRVIAFGQRVQFFKEPPLGIEDAMAQINALSEPPAYNADNNWCVAANFGILRQDDDKDKSKAVYLVDIAFVFADPNLYGIRVSLGGPLAKVFENFSFEIIYEKISDTLGVYKGTIVLPDRIRKLEFGAFSFSLPVFYAEIYTDGSFLIDFGFPKNADFSRSLNFTAQIGIFPVTGAAGFYFGRFSAAASGGVALPKTNKGLFNPVTVFGVGLKFGLGKSIDAGIFKGGFCLTLQAIIEGVFATFNPYIPVSSDCSYQKLSGAIGVVGCVYGSVDFAVISASIRADISLSVLFTIESYRASKLAVTASVSVSAELTINLGLFKIHIRFHFSLTVSQDLTIGSNTTAPWDDNRTLPFLAPVIQAAQLNFDNLTGISKETIRGDLSFPLSIASDEWGGGDPIVIGTILLTVEGTGFSAFCKKVFAWVLAAGCKEAVSEAVLLDRNISANDTDGILLALTQSNAAIPLDKIYDFMKSAIVINEDSVNRTVGETVQSVYFPIPPTTELDGASLKDCNAVSGAVLDEMRKVFDALALSVEDEKKTRNSLRAEKTVSMSEWLFADYFLFIARQGMKMLKKHDGEKIAEVFSKIDADISELGGMVSRYNLHGLRIKTDGVAVKNNTKLWVKDGAYPPELGVFALAGTMFDGTVSVSVKSTEEWFNVPQRDISGTGVSELKAYMSNHKEFSPNFSVIDDKPNAASKTYSFQTPYKIGEYAAWDIPSSIPMDDSLVLRFVSPTQIRETENIFKTASLIELELEGTGYGNVFIIKSNVSQNIAQLTEIVARGFSPSELLLLKGDALVDFDDIFALRLDLSTETQPPQDMISNYSDLCVKLFESAVTGNGGYVLAVDREADISAGKYTLVLVFDNVHFSSSAVKTVLSVGEIPAANVLIAMSPKDDMFFSSVSETVNSPITVSYDISRTPLSGEDALIDNNFSILRYSVCGGNFGKTAYSAPISANEDNVYSVAVPADNLYGKGKYAAAGKTIQLELQWVDIFGNTYNSAFVSNDILCGYKDELISVDNFPLVSADFMIKDGTIKVRLIFAQNELDIGDALITYQKISAQLNDPNGVFVKFECPATKNSETLDLAGWIKNDVIPALTSGKIPTMFEASFAPKPYDGLELLSEISANITITRKLAPAPLYENVQNIKTAVSKISIGGDILDFAKNYEQLNPREKVLKKDALLFRIRFGEIGIKAPEIYNIRPAFTSLLSMKVSSCKFDHEKGLVPFDAAYNSADGNTLLKNALQIIDGAFSPEIAGAAALRGPSFDTLVTAKAGIAAKLTEFLTPSGKNTRAKEAEDTAKQRFLSKLSNVYSLKAVVSYDASAAIKLNDSRTYGSVAASTNASGLSFSAPKINLYGDKAAATFAVSGSDVVFDKNGAVITEADIAVSYGVSHIESEIKEIADGYESSVWYKSLRGDIANADGGKFTAKFPLMFFPEQPQLTEQKQIISNIETLTAKYQFTYYNSVHYPQTTVYATVVYNGGGTAVNAADNSLFRAVADFDNAGGDILSALKSSASGDTTTFETAFTALNTLAGNLCNAAFTKTTKSAKNVADSLSFTVRESDDNGRFCMVIDSAANIEPCFVGYNNESGDKRTFFFTKEDDAGAYLSTKDGQAIRERTFKMPEKAALDKKSANVTLTAVNNADMGKDFALETLPVSFVSDEKVSAVIPDEISLNQYGDELNDCLANWFEKIGSGACEVMVSAESKALMKINPNLPYSEYPLFIQVGEVFSNYKDFTSAWANAVNDWIESAPCLSLLTNKGLKILFDIKFCDTSGAVIVETSKVTYIQI
ncbi:hypothetical protein FACS1894188_04600 [Clostridia bacterium]|nr:hypothetical protein FACS1894188_04600 [Clostridia bacterium]